jgi:predicted amidohydrolase YtcJ
VERASREGWEARFVEAAAAASRRFAAVGLTTVRDAAVGPALERRYREAEAAGQLAIRVLRLRVSAAGWFHPPWDEVREPGEGRTLKVFVDGGYRCAMRLARDGAEVTSGFLFYRRGELAEGLVRAWRSGWDVACHAIGNLGIETCLDALEDALRTEPAGAGRVRIEHALFLTPALIARLRALGVPVVVQPAFLYDGLARGRSLPPDLRPMPFASLRAAGVPLAFSSDYPCGTLAPFPGIFAAVTRRSRDGEPEDPTEALPVGAALEAYTIGAARAAGLAAECGSLAPGKRADLVLLEANPLAVAPEALRDLRVLETRVAGRVVWP